MDNFLQDVRYAFRALLRQKGFSITALVTLALGIGATTAIFSVVNSVILRPLPFDEPERVVTVLNRNLKSGNYGQTVSAPDFLDWKEQSRSFAALAYFTGGEGSVTVNNASEYASYYRVTAGFFEALGAKAVAGRLLLPEEQKPGGSLSAVITDAYWRRQFGSAQGAVGSTITFAQRAYTIVGVLAPQFRFPARADIYYAEQVVPAAASRSAHNYRTVGRLAKGTSLEQANAEMQAIARRLMDQYPASNADKNAVVMSLQDLILADTSLGDTRRTLFTLLGAVALVLLIACANVANLLLARATARSQELVVRSAIGAGRGRLVRQMLTESAVLAILAGIGGVVIARWGVAALTALAPADFPRINEVGVDRAALLFAAAISLASSVIFGLAPALQVSRVDLAHGLRQSGKGSALGRRAGWARQAFVVAEIALAVALVTGAGLLGRSLFALSSVDMGFEADHLVVLRTTIPVAGAEDFPRAIAAYRNALAELRALPGAVAVGGVTSLPTVVRSNGGYWIQGAAGPEVLGTRSPQAVFNVTTPGYFGSLRVPIVRGRDFSDADRIDAPLVAIVNEQLVRDAFPDVDPIGRTIRSGLDNLKEMTIVGVVRDVHTRGPARPVQAELFMPYEQHPGPATSLNIVLRTDVADPLALGATAARHLRDRNPDMPVRVESMEMTMAGATSAPKFRTLLLVVFAGVALVLAIAGVYGVMAYTVSQRVPEIGLRVALGATPGSVLGLVLKDGGKLVLIGLVAGAALSFASARFLSGLLFGVSARDPLVFVAVSLLVAACRVRRLLCSRQTRVRSRSAAGPAS